MIEQRVVDDVTVLTMTAGENRFNLPFVEALATAVDEAATRAKPLVITAEGKFFSNGLDLDWLQADQGRAEAMFPALYCLLGKILTFPGATAAAINGHAFGAGLILSAVADWRVMRADRGYFCFPEVDLGMAMSDEFDAVIQAKLPAEALLHALVTGHRYGAGEAVDAGLIHRSAGEGELLGTALGMVRDLAAKDGETIGRIKAKHFERVVELLCPDGL